MKPVKPEGRDTLAETATQASSTGDGAKRKEYARCSADRLHMEGVEEGG